MTNQLSKRQSFIVSQFIQKEASLRKKAFRKRFAGESLTPKEQRAVKRSKSQIIRIGFDKARRKDPRIPAFEFTESSERRVR